MKLFFLTLTLFLFQFHETKAQVIDYARMVVDSLASEQFHGRGYVNDGDKKAAAFIAGEFRRFGLKSFSKDFYQNFRTPVNTFPDEIHLQINNQVLTAGTDFLIEPGSPSLKGTFDVIRISAADLLSDQKLISKLQQSPGKLIVIEAFEKDDFNKEELERINSVIGYMKYHENNPASGTLILTNNKLTWSASTRLNPKPSLTIVADSLNAFPEKVQVQFENKFHEAYETQNVIGYVEGNNSDSLIVIMAHYDHLGKLGPDAIFTGANDNASGVAMLLSLARHYSQNKPEYSTVFIAFGAEELGLVGSRYFTENPLFELSKIKFLLNFDIAGTGDEGIQVVNGSVYEDKFKQLTELNSSQNLLPQVKIRGAACNSDHCMFDRQDVPGFYIYTLGGIPAYHDIYDRPETLPLTEFEDYFQLIVHFLDEMK